MTNAPDQLVHPAMDSGAAFGGFVFRTREQPLLVVVDAPGAVAVPAPDP